MTFFPAFPSSNGLDEMRPAVVHRGEANGGVKQRQGQRQAWGESPTSNESGMGFMNDPYSPFSFFESKKISKRDVGKPL